MTKLLNNYHCHTFRCGHATGTDEEYVLSGIQLGLKEFGFSDHVILPEGFEQPGIRGSHLLLEDYLNSINSLKKKYSDKIKIIVGFEGEYFPEMVGYYQHLLSSGADYLILGQHCYMKDGQLSYYFHKDCGIEDIRHYVDDVIKGLHTGLFKYLAHPDLFMHSQYEMTDELIKESRRILKCCEELNIPVELNLCGARRKNYDGIHYSYPNIEFFKLVKEYKVRVVCGVDAHEPSHFFQSSIDQAEEFAKRCGFNIEWKYSL